MTAICRRRFTLITFILVFCISVPACAGEADFPLPDDSQKVQAALRDSVRSLGLQTQLPAEKIKITAQEIFTIWDYFPSGMTAEFLLYCSLIIIAFILLKTWRDNLWSSSRTRHLGRSVDASPSFAEVAARMGQSQLEADELARQGNFAEAMHILLLRSLDELRRHLGVSIAVSLTSREILRHINLPPEGQPVLADIINRVEISYFGAHCPGADDYGSCRGSFDSLTEVLRRNSTSRAFAT